MTTALFLLLLLTNMPAQQQPDLTDNLVRYLGFYVFNYAKCKPPMFEKFRWISIEQFPGQDIDAPKADKNGYTVIGGYLETIDDERLTFKRATLRKNSEGKYEEFEFETEKIGGVHYAFRGNFLKRSVNDGGTFTNMRGNLTKYKQGEIVGHIVMAPFSKHTEH
jgi:hypothetical protein